MENQSKKPWILGKLKLITFFLMLFFCIANIISMCVIGGKDFFRNKLVDGINIIFFGSILLILFFEVRHGLIHKRTNTVKNLKNILTDILIYVIFGVLLFTIYFCYRRNQL